MTTHSDFRYSITAHTNDLAVLGCLRALADFAQARGNKRIAWGNPKKSDWERDNHHATFHFTTPVYRDRFVTDAARLLPEGSWTQESTRDDDPAQRAG